MSVMAEELKHPAVARPEIAPLADSPFAGRTMSEMTRSTGLGGNRD